MTAPRRFETRWWAGETLRLWCWGLAVCVLGPAVVRAGAVPLNKQEQERVNRAIDEGAAYLKRAQGPRGSWAGPKEKHVIGYAALPGLTLLECGVPADDPAVRRVAGAVRKAGPNLDATYEIALSILFLDRLGDPDDRELIQALAVRLIAGQAETGGWTYTCPIVGKKAQPEILAALRKLDAQEPPEGTVVAGAKPLTGTTAERKPANPTPEGTTSGPPSRLSPPSAVPELPKPADGKAGAVAPLPDKPAPKRTDPVDLPARLKALPVFKDPDRLVMRDPVGRDARQHPRATDNSNTQFALLALWVAQRHDVPARRSLRLIVRRFETSQNLDGSWGYRYADGGGVAERPSMDCVGLLGLAVGHGLARRPRDEAARKPVADPRILNGLSALGRNVGPPTGSWRDQPMENLYYLWSLERVGVLYAVPTIADKDWYRWGAEILIANQQPRGYWTGGGYHGSSPTIDTCLALLFLKRANFIADLTARLPFKHADLSQSVIQTAPSSAPSRPTDDPQKKP